MQNHTVSSGTLSLSSRWHFWATRCSFGTRSRRSAVGMSSRPRPAVVGVTLDGGATGDSRPGGCDALTYEATTTSSSGCLSMSPEIDTRGSTGS